MMALAIGGCGGLVRFEPTGEGGGQSTGPVSTTATQDQASSTGSSVSTASNTASSTGTGIGPEDPCLDEECGTECVVCNDQECISGYCDENGSCGPTAPPCATQVLCYVPDEPCVTIEQAPWEICNGCGGGKGCTFIGDVLDGPFVTPDGCCYSVIGECAPNP